MFDKEKFEEALTKAIDESATPSDAAAAMPKIMQQAMQGAFGQFGPMDAVALQQVMQKAQAQLMQKMQGGLGVPAVQAELIRQAQEKQQQETEAAARKAAEQVLAGKGASVTPEDMAAAMEKHDKNMADFTAKAKEQQAAQMAALKGYNPFGGNASMEMHGRDEAMKAASAMFQQRKQAMERASAPPVAGATDGTRTLSNGDTYNGETLGNKLHGKGVYWTKATGERYEGGFKDGHRYGKGIVYYANGDRLEWLSDGEHIEGQGKYFFADGRRYEGEFQRTNQTGKGVLYFPNGDYYDGVFKKGYTQSGTLYDKDGNVKKVGLLVPPDYVRPCMRGVRNGQEAAFPHDIVEFEQITTGPLLKWVDDTHVEFGSYPQTATDGVEKILWRVLEKKDGKLLLLSEKILESNYWDTTEYEKRKLIPAPDKVKDWKEADIEAAVLQWEECTTRKYLNGEFFEKAFTDKEKKQIVERLNTGNGAYIHRDYKPIKNKDENLNYIRDDTYATYEARGCRDTLDKVFLLNVEEAIKYFEKNTAPVPEYPTWSWNKSRIASPTDYLVDRGNVIGDIKYNCHHAVTPHEAGFWKGNKRIELPYLSGGIDWWLRNIGANPACMNYGNYYNSQTAVVKRIGDIDAGGLGHHSLNIGIRPAILINVP